MRPSPIVLLLVAFLIAGCGSSTSTTSRGGLDGDELTRADLAADWKNGVSSKGRWFARFASAKQIAFGCDVSDAKARRYHQQLNGSFPTSLLAELEADCLA